MSRGPVTTWRGKNVAGQHRFDVVHGAVDIGQLDCRADRGDGTPHRGDVGMRRQVGADVGGDLRLGHRPLPAGQRDGRARRQDGAVEQEADQRIVDPKLLHRRRRAEADLPADLIGARPESKLPQRQLGAHARGDTRIGQRLAHEWPSSGTS